MFSGIVETTGVVNKITRQDTNVHFEILCGIAHELKVDQSIAHNGACLTVVEIHENSYRVTAILETLQRTNLGSWTEGDLVNLERCLRLNDRLDGHLVQGHVDATAKCISATDLNGSWKFHFKYTSSEQHLTVAKGSICINGVSLTVVDSDKDSFSVCIIPYTMEHTTFKTLAAGDIVNIEFDILGKYVTQHLRFNNL